MSRLITTWERFVLELFHHGFQIEFEMGGPNQALRRIRIETQSAMSILIDDFDYEDLYCRFISHKEFEDVNFIFDCDDFNKFIDKLKNAIKVINEQYGSYNMVLEEFSRIKG